MAALTFFGVTGTFSAALKDSVYDVDTDPELAPMSGSVTFTPLIDSGNSVPAVTLTPASNLFLVPITAAIRSGVITSNGAPGVKLVANTAVLGLTGSLYYQVDFGAGLTAGGKTYSVRPFTFQAPTTATTVDLVEVTPAVGQPATGPVPSSAVLSVAGRTGNVVITPADVVGMEDVAHKNAANGYAGLDGNSKIALSAMPVGAMEYKGVWNASTNSPTLADGTGTAGFLYRVGTAGTRNLGSGSITFDVGDYVIHNGTTWEKSDSVDAVASVAGRTGAVTLTKTDVGLTNVDNTSDVNKPVSTAQAAADALKAPIASPTFTGTVAGITKAMVGLGSVDNTADTAKPVSTAQAAADAAVLAASAKAITGVQVIAVPTGTAATDTAAIQAAHDALPAAGGTIMAHGGLYALTNPGPTFTKKVHLIGISPADTNLAGGTIFWSSSTSATGLTLNPTASFPTGIGSTIENISFINNDTLTPASGIGLRVVDATNFSLRRCSFFNFYDHVSIEAGYAWTIQENLFNNCGRYAIRLRNTVDPDSGDGTITGNWFVPLGGAPTPTAAIRWESNAGVRIVNNKFNQGSKQWGIAIDAAFQGDVKNTGGIYIWNNSIENISGTGIKLSRITGAFVAYLTSIQNNEFQTVGTGIDLGAGWSNVIVSGNVGKTVTTPVTSSGALIITQANNQWNGAVTDTLGQSLIPTTNNTYSLGDSTHFFNSANLNTINSYYLNLYQNNSPFSGATQLQYQSPTSGNVVILPDASGLGTVEQFITLTASYTLTSQTAAQKLFNATTNGAVTLPVGTYFFECLFDLSSMSASSGSFGFAFGGTATIASQKWLAVANKAALATPASSVESVNTAANTALVTANTTTTGWAKITGKVRTSGVGTLVPQVSLGVAAAAVVGADSYFRIWAIGTNSVTNAGAWT